MHSLGVPLRLTKDEDAKHLLETDERSEDLIGDMSVECKNSNE